MSRIFHRPMFRKGGSAGGITSGLRRGFATGSIAPVPPEEIDEDIDAQYKEGDFDVESQDTVEKSTPSGNTTDTMLQTMMSDFPEPPKGSAASDFLMNLGLNLMSGPSTGSLFGNIGEAGKEPMKQFQSQRYADKVAKYKHGMQKKQFMLDAYSKLNDDQKIALEKEIEFWMSDAGGGKSREEALNLVMFRKPQNPKDVARQADLTAQENMREDISVIEKRYEDNDLPVTQKQAKKIYDFENWADQNNARYTPNEAIIDTTDFNPDLLETSEKTGNKILPDGVDGDRYIPNHHYLDVDTGILYKVSESGAELIVVDMVSE